MNHPLRSLTFCVVSCSLAITYTYGANPLLVASLRDNDILTKIDIEEDAQLPVPATTPLNQVYGATTSKVLEVSGVLERLSSSMSTFEEKPSSSEEITSQDELEKFTRALVRSNPKLSLVVVKENSVSVTRTVPTKLFWIFRTDGQETAEVISWGDGTSGVIISRPWWGMLSNYSTDEITVSHDIFSRMKNVPPELLTYSLSANTKARIISEIQKSFTKSNGSN